MPKDKLIDNGIKKLKRFGFTNVNKDNLLVDEVYVFYFKRFILIMKGENPKLDHAIDELLMIINNNDKREND